MLMTYSKKGEKKYKLSVFIKFHLNEVSYITGKHFTGCRDYHNYPKNSDTITTYHINVLKFQALYVILFSLNFGFYEFITRNTWWKGKLCRPDQTIASGAV